LQGIGGSPADLKAFIGSELRKWGPVVKEANISMYLRRWPDYPGRSAASLRAGYAGDDDSCRIEPCRIEPCAHAVGIINGLDSGAGDLAAERWNSSRGQAHWAEKT
jgi:hypothetical protein